MKDHYAEFALVECLLNGGNLQDVTTIVPDSSYFAATGVAQIFDAIAQTAAAGVPVNNETILPRLDCKDPAVLDAWLDTGLSTAGIGKHHGSNAVFFAEVVAGDHRQRVTVQTMERLNNSSDTTPQEIAAAAEMLRKLDTSAESTTHAIKAVTMRAIEEIEEAHRRRLAGESIAGVPYGIGGLDRVTGGMRPGQFIVIGARPSIGKTSLGLSIVNHAAITEGKKTLFVSLEMTEVQDAMRLISIRSGVPFGEVDQGALTKGNSSKIQRATREIAESNMMIETQPGMALPELAGQVHSMARDGLELVVIDYLGLLRYPQYSSGDNNYKEVSEISKGLKELALSTGIPVVAMAQLNRGNATASRPPKMSDLRDSGSIEQDADLVILLHRDDDVREQAADSGTEAALCIVDKNRNGPTGRVHLEFRKSTMEFRDWTQAEFPSEFD